MLTAAELLRGSDAAPALVTSRGEIVTYARLRAEVAAAAAALGAVRGQAVPVPTRDQAAALTGVLAALAAGGVPFPHARGVAELRAPPPPGAGLLLETSGSSGAPKIVVLGAAGVLANVDAILDYLPVRAHPRTALVLPLHYAYALVGQAFTTLRAGGALLLLGDLPYPALQVECMAELGASGLSSVPTSLQRLARAAQRPLPLGYVASAGARLDGATLAAVRAGFPGARVFNQWGLTEASPRVAAIADDDPAFAAGAVGRPLRGVEVESVDGELVVRGPSVMLGYLADPEATARALGPHGLRTGDLGRVEDGAIFVTGRAHRIVKVAGEKVSLDEVETVLRQAGADASVIAVDDELTGTRIIAFVVGAASVVDAQLAAREHLAPASRPAVWQVVDALPLTSSGKVDRPALRRFADLRSLVRELLAEQGEPPPDGDDDPLALDSLRLVILVEAIGDRLGVRVGPREVVQANFGSVARVAAFLAGKP
jgi:long-chain acyl-CoA synthetase